MAQSGISAPLIGDALELQKTFQKEGYPVAFVGSDVDKLKIFNVLTELKLARRVGPIPDRGSKEEKEAKAKAKDKDGIQPNLFKDEATNYVYEVADKPSAIISITGDAADMPEDHELEEAVASLTKICRQEKEKLNKFVLSSEAAHRAILANYVYREDQIKKNYASDEHKELREVLERFTKVKSMQISHLLGIRIRELGENANAGIKEKIDSLSKCFKYASVRDVLLDITKTLEENIKSLWSGDFDFPELKVVTESNSTYIPEPISCGKRLSKSR